LRTSGFGGKAVVRTQNSNTKAFGLKQMTFKRSEHKLVYEMKLVGKSNGHVVRWM
jgi:hypothetical protein